MLIIGKLLHVQVSVIVLSLWRLRHRDIHVIMSYQVCYHVSGYFYDILISCFLCFEFLTCKIKKIICLTPFWTDHEFLTP